MKVKLSTASRAFTLLETVIAIGVLAVLLTGFMVVFAPAAAGIRQSINVEQADRLATALEKEMGTFRRGDNVGLSGKTNPTGFDKAFDWLRRSNADPILVYQYRGRLATTRADGTPEPEPLVQNRLPGEDYILVPMARRRSDARFADDLAAVEGGVYLVRCTQLGFFGAAGSGLSVGTVGQIRDPKSAAGANFTNPDDFPEAVVAFSADFFMLPSKSPGYFTSASFNSLFAGASRPVFSRNLAVRR